MRRDSGDTPGMVHLRPTRGGTPGQKRLRFEKKRGLVTPPAVSRLWDQCPAALFSVLQRYFSPPSMARVREGKQRAKDEEEGSDWRSEVFLSAEELADLSRDLSSLTDRLEKPPAVLRPTYGTKLESVGFMTKNAKPKWKRVYMVLLGDLLRFYSARSKVRSGFPLLIIYFKRVPA